MQLTQGGLYHLYNRGIDRQDIFSSPENRVYFLRKVRKYLLPVCDILCYCIMPDHSHFLICTNEKSVIPTKAGALKMLLVSTSIKHSRSSYAKGYNKRYGRTGSLFQQITYCKDLFSNTNSGACLICFNYIHQNAWIAGLVNKIEDWPYSSFKDYAGLRNGTVCNKEKACELFGMERSSVCKDSTQQIDKELVKILLF